MGRVIRRLLASLLVAGLLVAVGAGPVAAFDGFGDPTADSTYGQEIRFTIPLEGSAPDRVELLVRTTGSEETLVIPVEPRGTRAEHVWDTSADYVTPNTLITYRWRAIDGDRVILSDEGRLRHDDDRPGLDWQSLQLGETTVHWYGAGQAQAIRFGEVAAVGVQRAELLLGSELAAPVDVFVYGSRDEFFGALGPGVREWTGAATYPELRTIFMWNSPEAGSPEYLETAMIHEVTHVVFNDATDNPFHEPARWLNEGIATWSETESDAGELELVQAEAGSGGLFSFDAITEQFPIGDRGALLSYAEGTTMVDLIVERYGRDAIGRITAAYRDGASDAEALAAGTGVAADDLYAEYYESFGVSVPEPIEPEPIPASNVDRPDAGEIDPGGVDPGAEPERPPEATPGEEEPADGSPILVIAVLAVALGAAAAAAVAVTRRADRRSGQ